ncbi:MAG: hypothetical protein ACM3VW_01325 [Bacteroidota bacterium]
MRHGLLSVLLVALILAIDSGITCGQPVASGGAVHTATATALPSVPPMWATPQERPLQFMSKQCNEDAIRVRLAPHPFQRMVAPGVSLALEEGQALLLILAQDCSEYWIDGQNLGPTQEMHVWLSIEGAKDTRPVVGAEVTRVTMTWFRLFHGSTNPRARTARTVAGNVETAIEGVSLDVPGPKRGGRVLLTKNLTYSWRAVSAVPPARVVGINHDVFSKTTTGDIVVDRIQALVHAIASASQGTLEVTGDTAMLPWVHAGSYPISVNTFFPIWARGTFGLRTTRSPHLP